MGRTIGSRTLLGGLLVLSGLSPSARPVAAQAIAHRPEWLVRRGDIYVATRERWRGIRRNVHPLLQADLLVGLKVGSTSFSAGGWSAVEPGDTRDEPRPDLRAGTLGFSTTAAWGQVAATAGGLTVAGGAIREWYRRVGGDPAVTEAYLTGRFQEGRWTPSVSIWHAVSGARGTYAEPTISFHHFVNPFAGPVVSWTSVLRAGFQLDQREPEGGAKVPGPEETGLTHIALGTTIRAAFPVCCDISLLASFGAELQYGRDPATRRRRDGSQAAPLAIWSPLQIGFSYPLGRPQ